MKPLALLLFALISLCLLPNPTHSTFNPICLPTDEVAVADTADVQSPVLDIADAQSPVRDTDGDELRVGQTYYVTNVLGTNNAGPQLAWLNSSTQCASDVVRSRCNTYGDPFRITPVDPNATVVSPSTFLSFSFLVSTSRVCASSVHWGVHYDQATQQYFLSTGEFDPDISARFQIEFHSAPNNYRIVYYPLPDNKRYLVSIITDPLTRAPRWVLRQGFLIVVAFWKTNRCSDFTL